MVTRVSMALSNGTWAAPSRASVAGGDRSGLVAGTYMPDEDTTGVLPGVTLTTSSGDLIVTTPGVVLENLDIFGQLIIRASNVTAVNCRVRGNNSNANRGLIDCTSAAATNFVGTDLTLIPDYPSYGWNAIIGDSYTLSRCHWQWTVDGCRGYNAAHPEWPLSIRVTGCYGGPLSFFSPDPNHTNDNRVHSDHFQIESGMARNHTVGSTSTWLNTLSDQADASVVIYGNSVWGWYAGGDLFPERWPGFNATTSDPLTNPPNSQLSGLRDANTSCIQVTPNLGVPVTGLWVEKNWFNGSSVGISLAGGAGSTKRCPGRFVDNVFDGLQKQGGNSGTSNAWTFSIKSPEYGDKDTPELLGTFTGNTNTATAGAARLGRVTA